MGLQAIPSTRFQKNVINRQFLGLSMLTYVLKRTALAVPVLLFVAVGVFFLTRLSPGDPAMMIAGDHASPEQLEAIRQRLKLDDPIVTQLVAWLSSVATGDFGKSIISSLPVSELVIQRLPPTISLALVATALTITVGIPLGVLASWWNGGVVDKLVTGVSVLGFSVPVFVTGYMLIGVFSLWLGWFPAQGYVAISSSVSGFTHRIVLPSLALSSIYIALVSRMTRSAMLDVLGEDYIRTARAKGISNLRMLTRHALRNALIPVLTVVATGFALMISGVVVTETVFNIPGVGRLLVDSILGRDYPVVQAIIIMTAASYVIINILLDISYAITDPRIKYNDQ